MSEQTRTRERERKRTVYLIEREQRVEAELEPVFAFFGHARNLEAITPRWLRFSVLTGEPIEMARGTRIEYELRLHGARVRWVTRIERWEPGVRFVDRQAYGPYALWHHTHEFERDGDATIVRDTVRYSLPFGVLGALAQELFVRRDLERIFDHREAAVARILAAS